MILIIKVMMILKDDDINCQDVDHQGVDQDDNT